MADFIPSADAVFDSWFKNLCQFVTQKTVGTNPEWKHIPAAEVTTLNKAYAEWYAAYEPCLRPHNEVQTRAKNTARAASEKVIRRFKHRNVDYRDEVSEANYVAMGFKVREMPAPRNAPTLMPEMIVENTRNRFEHRIRALNPQSGSFRKPAGAHGVCYACQVGGERPLSGAHIGKTNFSRKTSYTYTFTEAQKGQIAYYSICYESAKGDKGPWSPVEEIIIG